MVKHKGFIFLNIDGTGYFVNSVRKHTSQPNSYIFQTQDPETKKYHHFQIEGVEILEAVNSAYEEGDSLLIFDVSKGEWLVWAYNDLPPEMKKIYDNGKRRMDADESGF